MKLAGLTVKPGVEGAVPVPVSATVAGEFGALLTMLTDPARVPTVVGAKTALKVAVPPAAIVFGTVSPLTV